MADKFKSLLIQIAERTERLVRRLVLGARIHQRPLRTRERQSFAIAFQQILAYLGPYAFHQIADIAEDRIIAPYRMPLLPQIQHAYADQHGKQHNQQRSEEHTSEIQSLMRNSYAVFYLKKK